MRGDEVLEDADVVVKDNRIVAVGKRGTVSVPSSAKVIDVSGKTIVPGFILKPAPTTHLLTRTWSAPARSSAPALTPPVRVYSPTPISNRSMTPTTSFAATANFTAPPISSPISSATASNGSGW